MSGGKEAQLAFYYQNLVAVLKILNGLQEGNLVSAKIEQKVRRSSREVDMILEFRDGHFEYYEVKSGEAFTNNGVQIKDCLLALFQNFKLTHTQEQASYFLIINKDYLTPVAKFAADIRLFKTHTVIAPPFREYCVTWSIEDGDVEAFHEFIKILSLDHEFGLRTLKVQVLGEINKITDGIFMNAQHGLEPEDLLNRLIEKLITAIDNCDGVIDLQDMLESIVDWCTRNEIASHNPVQQKDLDEEKVIMRTKLQTKFPSIVIYATPSPSEAIIET